MGVISLDLELTQGGLAIDLVNWRQKRTVPHNQYKLFQFIGGTGSTFVDDEEHEHQANEIVFIPAHRRITHHSHGAISLGWIHFVPLSPRFDAVLASIPKPVVIDHKNDHALPWADIRALLTTPDSLNHYELQLSVAQLAVQAAQAYGVADQPSIDPRLATVHRHLERFYRERPSLERLARLVDLSPGYLHKQFRQAYGATPHDISHRFLMHDILIALRHSEATLDNIAEQFEFCDRFHLSKALKKFFGQTATELRSRRSEKP